MAVKAASVGEFQGKTLSVGRDSEIILDFAEDHGQKVCGSHIFPVFTFLS